MTNGMQRWRVTGADEPSFGGSLDWDRWARRLTLASYGAGMTLPTDAAGVATPSTTAPPAHCNRHRVTANLERLIEELHKEADRLSEQAAELLFTEVA